MHLEQGRLLQGGKYEIVRYISSGGFGCTYEARHRLLRKTVAIKEFFVKDFCNRDSNGAVYVATQGKVELVDRLHAKFIDEAAALCELNHPYIVRVTDVFEENGTAYYVMDYIDGCSLAAKITEKGRLAESEALAYIRQVADALQYVHSKNRLHLDIKPQNIMIDTEGQAILIDFGVSKQYDEVNGENTSTLLGSTPGYAPIEQIGNNVVSFTPATDIYALGATLYKALSGVTPLAANLLACGETLEPLPDVVSEKTRGAVETAMDINRRKRPQCIGEFLNLLESTENRVQLTDGREQSKELREESEETVLPGVMGESDVTRIESGVTPCNSAFVNRVFAVDGVEFKMVAVEGGTFQMSENRTWQDGTIHDVNLSDYYIGETEVTQELWLAVMSTNPSRFKGNSQRPVESVSWDDCQEFIVRLNEMTGMNFRLPTEAEWEYAARGGNCSQGYKYSGSDNIDEVAWYWNNSDRTTHPVKCKNSNELGLYDMSGNVWEWCSDWYSSDYYSISPKDNPQGPSSGSGRVLRGGSWYDISGNCHAVTRDNCDSDYRDDGYGLRLAL